MRILHFVRIQQKIYWFASRVKKKELMSCWSETKEMCSCFTKQFFFVFLAWRNQKLWNWKKLLLVLFWFRSGAACACVCVCRRVRFSIYVTFHIIRLKQEGQKHAKNHFRAVYLQSIILVLGRWLIPTLQLWLILN